MPMVLGLILFLSPGHSFHPAFILIFSESHLSPSLSSPGQGRREEEPREGGRPGLMRDERSGPGLRSGGRAGPGQEVGQARVAPAWRRGAASAGRPGGTARRGAASAGRPGGAAWQPQPGGARGPSIRDVLGLHVEPACLFRRAPCSASPASSFLLTDE